MKRYSEYIDGKRVWMVWVGFRPVTHIATTPISIRPASSWGPYEEAVLPEVRAVQFEGWASLHRVHHHLVYTVTEDKFVPVGAP